jgi:hypothetical protein
MSFTGNLVTVSFPDLLQLISTGGKTGMLSITKTNQKKEIYFSKGDIIYATSTNNEDELLGTLLLRRGKISKLDLQRSLSHHKMSGKKLGAVLVELKLVTPEELRECLNWQVEEIVYNLFAWESGEFEFTDDQMPSPDQITTQLNTVNVIMEGTRRIDEWMEIQKGLPQDNIILQVNPFPKVEGEISLSAEEFQIFTLINGERALPDILAVSPFGEFITSKALYSLISKDFVLKGVNKTAQLNRQKEEEFLSQILSKIYSACFVILSEIFSQKLGRQSQKLLKEKFELQKSLFPILSWSCDGINVDLSAFWKNEHNLNFETKFHQALESLNSLLLEYFGQVSSVLGTDISQQIIGEIKKTLQPLIAEHRGLAKKYEIEEELYRILRKAL